MVKIVISCRKLSILWVDAIKMVFSKAFYNFSSFLIKFGLLWPFTVQHQLQSMDAPDAPCPTPLEGGGDRGVLSIEVVVS